MKNSACMGDYSFGQRSRTHVLYEHLFTVKLKVTVQFETKGNGQNEIVSHMDRSEEKLQISEKEIVISHIQNEILKQKNFIESEIEGAQNLLNAFFSRLFLC